ncbi:hypothetical protein BASA81_012925 [Batrachochytrium salamandrivorans]|nr:hypothetical protein BASA81_012925 [Batrachochytrium salamandrivorans]
MAPTRFGDFSKKGADVFSNDYSFDRKFKWTTRSAAGVTFTNEATLKPKKLDGKFTAKWSPAEGLFVDKLSISSEGRIAGEATLKNALVRNSVSSDLVVRVQDGANQAPQGELEVKFSGDKFTLDVTTDVVSGPTIVATSSFQLPNSVLLGASVKVNTKLDDASGASPEVKDFNLAASYTKNDVIASFATKCKLSEGTFTLHNNYNKSTTLAAQVTLGATKGELKSMQVGAIHQLDADTKLQTKVDNKGVISANYILQVKPDVKAIASVQVDALNFAGDAHKLGLSLILG